MNWLPTSFLYTKEQDLNVIPRGKHGLYRLYLNNGELAYIGVSKDLRFRVNQHFSGGTQLKFVCNKLHTAALTFIEDINMDDFQSIGTAEQLFISMLRPRYNTTNRKKPPWWYRM